MAIPGSIVASGKLVTPGGAQGVAGGTGPAGPTAVSTDAGNLATLGSDSLISVPPSGIWSVRLRSYNALGNSGFECDQKLCGTTVTLGAGNITTGIDRWLVRKNAATGTLLVAQSAGPGPGPVIVPGTSFAISQNWLALKVGTVQATLAAGEYIMVYQSVEGSAFRELSKDVSSTSLLIYSQAAITISVNLVDGGGTYSITYPASIPANQLTLVALPNIPLWPSGGTFSTAPGTLGYTYRIGFGAGSTFVSPTSGAWVNSSYLGLSNTTNFLSLPTNTLVWLGFVQHEPGPLCSTLIDKPFTQSLDECLRYYQKSYNYGTAVGAANAGPGMVEVTSQASQSPVTYMPFPKRMAKAPNVTLYSSTTGAINTVRDSGAAADRGVTSAQAVGEGGYSGASLSAYNATATIYQWHFSADTGW